MRGPHPWIGLALCLLSACASDPMRPVRDAYIAGDYRAARTELAALVEDDTDNAHLFQLEAGMVDAALGEPKPAIAGWRTARDRMDQLRQDGMGFADFAKTAFLDDTVLPWPGADYEHVLVRAVLATLDLMAGGHDAEAYALQVLETQQRIIQEFEPTDGRSPKESYKLVAYGNYLRGTMKEAEPRGRSEAVREYQKVVDIAPRFGPGPADLGRAKNESIAPRGHGVVHVIAFVGMGPYRVETKIQAGQGALNIAKLIWSYQQDRPWIPNPVPVPIPTLAFYADNPETANVRVGSELVGQTATITDVEELARSEFDSMQDYAVARALVRRLWKTAVIEAGKEIAEHQRSDRRKKNSREADLVNIGLDIAGILWTAAESADLRCWNFVPARIQVLRLVLPEGEHELSLRAVRGGNETGVPSIGRVRVLAGYNTYVLGILPTLRGGPPLLGSR